VKNLFLLHFGDIHFGSIDIDDPAIDKKDQEYPEKLTDIIEGPRRFTKISKSLVSEIRNRTNSFIIISGDLTTQGNVEKIEECLKFLKNAIPKEYFGNREESRVFIVPGNHDIDRTKVDDEDLRPKFSPLIASMKKEKFTPIPCLHANIKNFKKDDCSIVLFLLNSCIGCGERRYFPKEIREKFQEFIESGENINSNFPLFEIIDTPLISDECITDITDEIKRNHIGFPIIVTHHNLLPSKSTEIAQYSGLLLNGGKLRDALVSLNRPILFIHGHVHEDSIEIIQSPKYLKSKIICISVPLLFPNKKDPHRKHFGYNKFRVIFSDDNEPLGIEIISFRLNGGISENRERIKFLDPPESLNYLSDLDKKILDFFRTSTKAVYNIKEITMSLNDTAHSSFTYDDIEKSVDQLDWLGIVKYEKEHFEIKGIKIPNRYVGRVI
jgi:Icc-related predicted phosphoesterase